MLIKYLQCSDKKLFSFYKHDYQTYEDKIGNHYMLDGGISTDPDSYYRKSKLGEIKESLIATVIKDIREQYIWGRNYDKDNNRLPKTEYILLKDLSSSHICGILRYFTDKLNDQQELFKIVGRPYNFDKSWFIIHSIFIEELDYRINNNLI